MRNVQDLFFDHKRYESHRDKYANLMGPNGWLLFVACDAGTKLAEDVHSEYSRILREKSESDSLEIPNLMKGITNKFERSGKDGTCPRLSDNVAGADVYIFQNCMDYQKGSHSVNNNLVQLVQTIYTLKDQKANKVTAILPYFPYSRQDKPSFKKREYTIARSVADMISNAGADSVVSYHPHSISLKGLFPVDKPFNFISGIDIFLDMFEEFKDNEDTVAVSTDAGGLKEVKHFAENLGISYCAGTKDRPEQKKTKTLGVQGSLEGKTRAIIIDDETATFSSVMGIIENLYNRGVEEFHIGISHMRTSYDNMKKFILANKEYNMISLHTTDSIPQIDELSEMEFVHIHSLASMWAGVINRMHYDLSVSELFKRDK